MSKRKKPLTESETDQEELIQKLEEIIEELKNKESKKKRVKEKKKKGKNANTYLSTFVFALQMKTQVFSFGDWCKL